MIYSQQQKVEMLERIARPHAAELLCKTIIAGRDQFGLHDAITRRPEMARAEEVIRAAERSSQLEREIIHV